MRKGSNQQNCGSTVGCYESVGLNTEKTKVGHILTELSTTRQLLVIVVRRKLSFFRYTIRDGGCELVKCAIQGKVNGKRRRGRHRTSYIVCQSFKFQCLCLPAKTYTPVVAVSGQRRPAKPSGALCIMQSTTTCCVMRPQARDRLLDTPEF